jgi:hypothetical protein
MFNRWLVLAGPKVPQEQPIASALNGITLYPSGRAQSSVNFDLRDEEVVVTGKASHNNSSKQT